MPFVARCHRCGHIESARTRCIIDVCREEHDRASHGSYEPELWAVIIVSNADYNMFQQLSKTPAFWASLRLKFPRFSGLVSGEISLSAN